jgi:hypothetical protein
MAPEAPETPDAPRTRGLRVAAWVAVGAISLLFVLEGAGFRTPLSGWPMILIGGAAPGLIGFLLWIAAGNDVASGLSWSLPLAIVSTIVIEGLDPRLGVVLLVPMLLMLFSERAQVWWWRNVLRR